MKNLKKILKVVGGLIVILVIAVAGFIYSIFGSQQPPRSGPPLGHGIEQVADMIATIYILDAGNGKLALIDAGNDPSGAPILAALSRRGKSAADVIAIFITHAHPDHDAAVKVFPNAQVYALQEEVEVAVGKEPYGSPLSKVLGAYNPHPFTVSHPLHDGETVQVGTLPVTAFKVSGHTRGSAAYLAQGTLFTGDAFFWTKDHKAGGPVGPFSRSVPEAIESLKSLVQKLSPRAAEIEFITTSHSGTLTGAEGLAALRDYVSAR